MDIINAVVSVGLGVVAGVGYVLALYGFWWWTYRRPHK